MKTQIKSIGKATGQLSKTAEAVMIRVIILQSLLAGILFLATCSSHTPAIPPARQSTTKFQAAAVAFTLAQPDSPRVDYFKANISPLLEKQCQPCHFKGGKVYTKLPFDNPKTIRLLGTKLFTRIHDEKEQAVIRTFLVQAPDSTTSSASRQKR